MDMAGEFVLSSLRETQCFREKTVGYGIWDNWVYILTLLFNLWSWAKVLKCLIFNILVCVNEFSIIILSPKAELKVKFMWV